MPVQALSPPTPQKPKVTLSPCRGLCYCQGLDLHSYTLWVGIGEWTKWRVAIRQGFRKKWEVWHQEKTASLLYPVGLIYPFPCCWPGGGVFSPLGGLWSMRESGPRSPALDATSPGRTTRISVRIDWQMARPILCSQRFWWQS
jgi:hypothetical protein